LKLCSDFISFQYFLKLKESLHQQKIQSMEEQSEEKSSQLHCPAGGCPAGPSAAPALLNMPFQSLSQSHVNLIVRRTGLLDDDFDGGGLCGAASGKVKMPSTVDIRNQQRAGKKSITTIAGLESDLDLKLILKNLRKTFATNGTIVDDTTTGGSVIQLQGDIRKEVSDWLHKHKICEKSRHKVHGF
jgi:translation initiation factor 1